MKYLALSMTIFIFSCPLWAAAENKHLKYGITPEQFMERARCTIRQAKAINAQEMVYYCSDFLYLNTKVLARFAFINNRLFQVSIFAGNTIKKINRIIDAQITKHSHLYQTPSQKQVKQFFRRTLKKVRFTWEMEAITWQVKRLPGRIEPFVLVVYRPTKYLWDFLHQAFIDYYGDYYYRVEDDA